jgi:hypothetical protein
VYGLAGPLGFADEGTEVARSAVLRVSQAADQFESRGPESRREVVPKIGLSFTHLHNDVDPLVLDILDLLNELDNVTMFQAVQDCAAASKP